MSPDIEAVHRLLLDQKASFKKLFSARASYTWYVVKCAYIFNPGVECGQTLHWEVPDRVHPRVPPRLSHCLFPGLTGLPQEACSPRMKAHTTQVWGFLGGFFGQLLQSQKNKDPTHWSWSTPQLVKSVWPLSETNWSRMGETDPYASLWHFTDKSSVQALSFLHLSLLDLWIFYSH